MSSPDPFRALPGPDRASQFPSFSFDTRRLYLPRRARPLHTPAASWTMLGFGQSGSVAALKVVSRGQIEFAYATARVFARTGLHTERLPADVPVGLHGKRVIPW